MFSEFPLSHETDIPESRQLAALAASRNHFHLNGPPMRPGVSGAGMDTGRMHGPLTSAGELLSLKAWNARIADATS